MRLLNEVLVSTPPEPSEEKEQQSQSTDSYGHFEPSFYRYMTFLGYILKTSKSQK